MYTCAFCGRSFEPLDAPTEVAGRAVCSPSCMERECARQTDGAHVGDGPTCGRRGRARKLVGAERGAAFAARAEAAGAPQVSMLACAEAPKRVLPGRSWRVLAHEEGERVELRNRGTFDELVVDSWLHLEQMSMRDWQMQLGPLSVAINLSGSGTTRIRIDFDYAVKSTVEIGEGASGVRDGEPWWGRRSPTADEATGDDDDPFQPGPYTREQFAAAVDEAHGALHALDLQLEDQRAGSGVSGWAGLRLAQEHATRAHEALHRVGAGSPRIACANGERDPETRRLIQELGVEARRAELGDPRSRSAGVRVRRSDPTSTIVGAVGEVLLPLLREEPSSVIAIEVIVRPARAT